MGSICFKVKTNKVAVVSGDTGQQIAKLPSNSQMSSKQKLTKSMALKKIYVVCEEPAVKRATSSTLRLFSQPKFDIKVPSRNQSETPKEANLSPRFEVPCSQDHSKSSEDSWADFEHVLGKFVPLREGVYVFKLATLHPATRKFQSMESLMKPNITPTATNESNQLASKPTNKPKTKLRSFDLCDQMSSPTSHTSPSRFRSFRQEIQIDKVKRELLRVANIDNSQ